MLREVNRQEIADKVQHLIAEHLGLPAAKVTPEAKIIEDLGADSLDLVELLMRAEEEWPIEISDDEGEKVSTVIQAVDLIQSKLEQ